jgi:hypothetical protein
MKSKTAILFVVTTLMVAGAAACLAYFHSIQRLGRPGVRTVPLGAGKMVEVLLPTNVPSYKCQTLPVTDIESNTLPADTCFGKMYYSGTDGFEASLSVVLMGTDRTSLHKPQFCLEGQGWHIDQAASSDETVSITEPVPYDLPVVKLIASKEFNINGQRVVKRGIYVYWFVADNALSASQSGFQRMWWMAEHLVRTGELQRWAYISYLTACDPGQEEQTFQRLKKLISETVPSYQLYPAARATVASAGK